MTALSTVRYVAACPACTHVAIWQATITGSIVRGEPQVDYRITCATCPVNLRRTA